MKTIRIINSGRGEAIPLFYIQTAYPELSHGVDVLGFEKGVIVAVHQTFPMDYSCIVH